MGSVGTGLLIVALVAGVAGVVSAGVGRLRRARWFATLVAATIVAATGRLMWAIAKLDFSFEYVASQSRARTGGAYRIAALWGGAEGSLLFFSALLAIVMAAAAWRFGLGRWGLAVGIATIGGLAGIVAAAANPFSRAALPAVRGAGLTPILEHPAMLYHPPILYLGLVATVVPFLLVIDDPVINLDRVGLMRRWTLIAWTLLTVGLATGANWAYVELGWGGYWAWDPVENTVLMPWLLLTAALHLGRTTSNLGRPWMPALGGLLPFVFVVFGAAVTRSGGLSSVHAFADAEALGWSLGLLTALAMVVCVHRMSPVAGWRAEVDLNGRDRFLVVSVLLAIFMTVVVLMGVGVPLLPGSNRIVTATFYNQIGTPLLVVVLLGMAAFAVWTGLGTLHRQVAVVVGGLVVALGCGLLLNVNDWLRWTALGLGAVAVGGHLAGASRIPIATIVGHLGFVVLAFGIASSAQAETTTTVLAPGESVEFGEGEVFVYESFLVTDGPRLQSEAVTVQGVVTDAAGRELVRLAPALVSYPDRGVALAETALHSTPARDLQVVLRTITDEGLGSFELSRRPALMLVWWGSTLIALSGVVALRTKAAIDCLPV